MSSTPESELRELDAAISERVMGIPVLGKAVCWWAEGSCSVTAHKEPRHCGDSIHPVILDFCCCENAVGEQRSSLFDKIFNHETVCLTAVPFYSRYIEDAWKIVDHLLKRNWSLMLDCDTEVHYASFTYGDQVMGTSEEKTASLAICKAALNCFPKEGQ